MKYSMRTIKTGRESVAIQSLPELVQELYCFLILLHFHFLASLPILGMQHRSPSSTCFSQQAPELGCTKCKIFGRPNCTLLINAIYNFYNKPIELAWLHDSFSPSWYQIANICKAQSPTSISHNFLI